MNDYLIWSNEHRAWWKGGEAGYTTRISEAGHYTRGRAIEICSNALFGSKPGLPNELPVSIDDVRSMFVGPFAAEDGAGA